MTGITHGRIKRMALRTRIALATSLLFVFFAASSGSFIIWKMHNELSHTIGIQQHALAVSIAGNIDSKMAGALSSLKKAATRLSIQKATIPGEAQRFLDDRAALPAIFDRGIWIFDRHGKPVAHSPAHSSPTNVPLQLDTFIQTTITSGKAGISDPYQPLEPENGPELMMAAPIKDSSGAVAFIFAGSLQLLGSSMLGELAEMKIGKLGYVFLVTRDHTVLYHPNSARIMKKVPEEECSPLFIRAMQGFDGSGECVNPGGIKILSSFRPLRSHSWILGISHPLSEAYAVIDSTQNNLIAGFTAGTLLILVLTWLVINHLTSSLAAVTRQVEEMDEQNLKLVQTETKDYEIGMLAQAFNRLVRELQIQQNKLREEKRKYRTVADNTYDWEFWVSPDNRFIYSSPSCKWLTGYDASDFEAFPDMLERIVFLEDRQAFLDHQHTMEASTGMRSMEFRLITAGGELRWVSHICQPVRSEDGAFLGVRGSNRDITAQKQAEQKLHELMGQQQVIIDNIPDMAWLKDREGRYIQVNRQFSALCGLQAEEIIGRSDEEVWPPDLAHKYRDDDKEVMSSRMRRTFESHVVDRAGKAYYMEMVKSPLFDDRGEAIGVIGIAHDITRRMQEELILRHASTHDPLTGLYNRTYFEEEMQRFARSRRYPVSIIMGDVNDLKEVNDSHGHAAGDRLLCLAAKSILDAFRGEDIVARIGGDEFAILLPETDEATAAAAIERIRGNLETISETEMNFKISIALGMATAREGEDLQHALKLSDQRMYQQKAAHKAFTPADPSPVSNADHPW